MKTKKQSLGQWLLSLFFKSKKVKPSNVEIKTEEVMKDPFCKTYTSNEMPDLKFDDPKWVVKEMTEEIKDLTDETEKVVTREYVISNNQIVDPSKKFTNYKMWSVGIDNEVYQLTEKQFVFYTIIKRLQSENENKYAHGKQIMLEFHKMKHPEMSLTEIKNNIPAKKLHFTNYGSTTKFLFKSGLLLKVKKNHYQVKE